MTPLRTDALTKHFGAHPALESLDLTVERGEVVGYLGPNGAGKTTTLRLLLDFVRPTSGSCSVLGSTARDPVVRGRIGYLPGELRVDPTYTARDLIEFFAALDRRVDRAYADALIERFQLDPTRPYRELSTGNRRKVGIVQAFMHRPEVLLLDEPTSGLDPLLQVEFAALVREANEDGATVLLSSHMVREVETLAHRVAILRRGRLVAMLDIDELRDQARQRIDLHLARPAPPDAFDGVDGVRECTVARDVVHLVVEGSVDAALKAAARLDVRRIVTHDTDLEDVFLGYYRDGS